MDSVSYIKTLSWSERLLLLFLVVVTLACQLLWLLAPLTFAV